jgi:hypothetical protein
VSADDLPTIVIDLDSNGPRTLPCPTCGERVLRLEGLDRSHVEEYANGTSVTVHEPLRLLPCGHQAGSVSIRYVP